MCVVSQAWCSVGFDRFLPKSRMRATFRNQPSLEGGRGGGGYNVGSTGWDSSFLQWKL